MGNDNPDKNIFPALLLLLLLSRFSRVRLCATPQTAAHQAPLSLGFSRQEYWSGLPFPPPGDFPDARIRLMSVALAGEFFTTVPIPAAAVAAAKSLQSCPTLCDPIDGSPPGSTIPGILQERTLEWVAISSSKRSYRNKVKSLSHVRLFMTS